MEFMSTSINTHVYAIVALLLMICYNFYIVLKEKDFIVLVKKLKFNTPIFHMLNAIVAYTGGIIAGFSHDLSITVILMIATTIFIMVSEIKRYKKMRVIKIKEYDKQNDFVVFAKKIYTLQAVALMFTYTISKIF